MGGQAELRVRRLTPTLVSGDGPEPYNKRGFGRVSYPLARRSSSQSAEFNAHLTCPTCQTAIAKGIKNADYRPPAELTEYRGRNVARSERSPSLAMHGVLEFSPEKMPPDHGAASKETMTKMGMHSDPLVHDPAQRQAYRDRAPYRAQQDGRWLHLARRHRRDGRAHHAAVVADGPARGNGHV